MLNQHFVVPDFVIGIELTKHFQNISLPMLTMQRFHNGHNKRSHYSRNSQLNMLKTNRKLEILCYRYSNAFVKISLARQGLALRGHHLDDENLQQLLKLS